MSMPTAKQLDDWSERLSRLLDEIRDASTRDTSKLENLTLYAWQEARAEREKLDQLATFEEP